MFPNVKHFLTIRFHEYLPRTVDVVAMWKISRWPKDTCVQKWHNLFRFSTVYISLDSAKPVEYQHADYCYSLLLVEWCVEHIAKKRKKCESTLFQMCIKSDLSDML